MNLFELQQRANILVQKVNEYEAGLTGTTIDEEDTLNQHTYADLYCLRPVMKLLFGATLAEKLNRTLDNDLPLRVFASSAPAWNSTFNLLSYNPGKIIDNTVTYTSLNSSYSVPQVYTEQEITNYKYNASKPLATLDTDVARLHYGYENLTFTTGSDVQTTGFILSQDLGLMLYQKQGRLEMNKYGGTNPTVIIQELQPNTTYYTKGYIYGTRFEYSTDKANWTTVNLNGNYAANYSRRVYFGAEYNGINPFPGTIDLSEMTALRYDKTPSAQYSISLSKRYLGLLFGTVQIDNLFISANHYSYWLNPIEARIQPERPLTTKNTEAGSQSAGDSYIYKTRYTVVNDNNLTGTSGDGLQLFRIRCHNDDYSTSSDIVEYVYGYQAKEFRFSGSSTQINLTLPRILKIGDTLDVEFRLWVAEVSTGRYCMRPYYILTLNKGKDDEWSGGSLAEGPYWNTNKLKPTTVKFCSGAFNLCQDLSETYVETYISSYDVGYKSDQHEFMNNIDVYNNYNMCQLDITQNSVTNKDTRIPLGINYSYSANIADALVTECQVANLFNWNTTTSTQIANNTISINRQVPGIVCYYLGNGYNSSFTATIPYSPRLDNINSINYGTPPYYGAFYRNGSDIEISQVGLQMGAEACRIFMPGLNYTRGKLESPQQIWQPEKLVGDDNIDKGFNWQGRAIYHELVFKNRRAGSSDAGVDFKPTLDSVADNDPQGLATRFALAQQKPFYNNRPWFKELDELYGVDSTKLINFINNNSVIIPDDKDRIVLADFVEAVGTPDIDENGIYSNITSSNYLKIVDDRLKQIGNEFVLKFKTSSTNSGEGSLYFGHPVDSAGPSITKFDANLNNRVGNWTNSATYFFQSQPNTDYWLKVKQVSTSSLSYSYSTDGDNWTSGTGSDNWSNQSQFTHAVLGARMQDTIINAFSGTIDLLNSGIIFNGSTEMTPFAVKHTGVKPVFDKSLFTLTGDIQLDDNGILSFSNKTNPSNNSYASIELPEITLQPGDILEIYSPTSQGKIYTCMDFPYVNNKGVSGHIDYSEYGDALLSFKPDAGATNSTNVGIIGNLATPSYSENAKMQSRFIVKYLENNNWTWEYYTRADNGEWTKWNYDTNSPEFVQVNPNATLFKAEPLRIHLRGGSSYNQTQDLSTLKMILNGQTILQTVETPGTQPMNDTEFYNQYKLDYNTWANALNKPL